MQAKYELANEIFKTDKERGLLVFLAIIEDLTALTEEDIKLKEMAVYSVIDYFSTIQDCKRMGKLLQEIRPLLANCPQTKTAKIIKSAFDELIKIPNSLNDSIIICKDIIDWCAKEKRTFLKLRMEVKLANLYFMKQLHKDALNLISILKVEIKKIEDVTLHVDVNLTETKIHIELENVPKAKASLTAVKTAATSINLSPGTQVEIDLLSGILAAEDRDYNTGYSYFYEAMQMFMKLNDNVSSLKTLLYMMLCKIMSNHLSLIHI